MTREVWLPDPPLIAVVRVTRGDAIGDEQLLALVEGGLRAVEIALTAADGLDLIRRVRALMPGEVAVGAGTVLERDEAAAAVEAGASFLASPADTDALDPTGPVQAYPGVCTPSEVHAALARGHRALKLFPALAGPELLAGLRPPFPAACLLPSGGVSAASLPAWRGAGAAGAFIGGSLLGGDAGPLPPEKVAARARAVVEGWSAAQG